MTSRHQIPNNWEWVQIGSVAKTSSGGTPSRKNPENYGGGIPWVKSGELGDGKVLSSEETISELGLNSSSAKIFPKGTLCIALYGATVGKLGILEIDAATNQAVCGIFLPDEIDRDFTYYYLLSLRPRLIELGKGGAQPNISQEIVRSIWLPKPPLSVQRAIVAKLDELLSDLDAGVANLKRAQANLRRYKAAILSTAVNGRLTEKWREQNPPTETGGQYLARILAERRAKWEADQLAKFAKQDKVPPAGWQAKYAAPSEPDISNLPELPMGWCWTSLGQLLSNIEAGKSFECVERPPTENEYGVAKVSAVSWGAYNEQESKTCLRRELENDAYLIKSGDFLFSRANTIELVGACVIAHVAKLRVMLSDKILRFNFVVAIDTWVLHVLRSHWGRKEIERLATGNQESMRNIGQDKIRKIRVPLPPMLEQHEIVSQAEDALSIIEATESEISRQLVKATSLRQAILKSAFSGKLLKESSSNQATSEAAA